MRGSLRIFVRRLFTTISMLSLLLCLATVTLWVRSMVRMDHLSHWSNNVAAFEIYSGPGRLHWDCIPFVSPGQPRDGWRYLSFPAPPGSEPMFGFERSAAGSSLTVPFWLLALFSALLPTYSTISILRHRKQRLPGHCCACGYDLRATPERCPECGTAR